MISYPKEIDKLIKGRDFFGLIKKLVDSSAFDKTPEDNKADEKGVYFLYKHIKEVIALFNSGDNQTKYELLDAFELAQHPHTISLLFEAAIKGEETYIRKKAKAILLQKRRGGKRK